MSQEIVLKVLNDKEWKSAKTIAQEIEVSDNAVRKCLHSLERQGFVESKLRTNDMKRRFHNVYRRIRK